MKKIALFALICAAYSTTAQITVTDSDFPNGGDTAMVSISSDFELDFGSTGTDYLWNFEALTFTEQRIDTFFDVDDASIIYQLVFNNGWLDPDYEAEYYTPYLNFAIPSSDLFELPITNPVNFTKVESDKIEIVGVGMEIGGIEVPVKNEVIDVEYELPLNYEDSWVSNSFFEIDLNPAFDGILRRYQERTTEVDGWGVVKTPFGSFDALRTVSYIDFTDSLRIAIGGGDPTWVELPTPSQVVYSWWTNDQKIPVLQVVASDFFGTETVNSVEYKDRDRSDLSIENNAAVELVVYPNPSNGEVVIKANSIQQISIFDMAGKQVAVENNLNTNQFDIDLGELQAGLYLLHVQTASGSVTRQIKIQ